MESPIVVSLFKNQQQIKQPAKDWLGKKEVRLGIQFMRQGNKMSGIAAIPHFPLLRRTIITKKKKNLTTRTAYIVLLLSEKK
jgi:hypothetical protein